MKIYICDKNYGESINFIEDENTFLGYDYGQSCCEDFGWKLAEESNPSTIVDGTQNDHNKNEDGLQKEYPGYKFDKSYESVEEHNPGGGGEVTFRLIKDGAPNLILTIYNYHNGYYGHGFTFTIKGKAKVQGYI
jgi:hypothetical protein